MIKTVVSEFLRKFYEVVIVILVALLIAAVSLSIVQTIRLNFTTKALEGVEQKHQLEKAEEQAKLLQDLAAAQKAVLDKSAEYEALYLEQSNAQKIIYQPVEKIITRDVYRCIGIDDDGLSALNAYIETYDPSKSTK